MSKNTIVIPSQLQQLLTQTGAKIRLARLRRNLSTAYVMEHAGISRKTLQLIEKGMPTVSMGAYLLVLSVLEQEKDILQLATDEALASQQQEAGAVVRARAPRRNYIQHGPWPLKEEANVTSSSEVATANALSEPEKG